MRRLLTSLALAAALAAALPGVGFGHKLLDPSPEQLDQWLVLGSQPGTWYRQKLESRGKWGIWVWVWDRTVTDRIENGVAYRHKEGHWQWLPEPNIQGLAQDLHDGTITGMKTGSSLNVRPGIPNTKWATPQRTVTVPRPFADVLGIGRWIWNPPEGAYAEVAPETAPSHRIVAVVAYTPQLLATITGRNAGQRGTNLTWARREYDRGMRGLRRFFALGTFGYYNRADPYPDILYTLQVGDSYQPATAIRTPNPLAGITQGLHSTGTGHETVNPRGGWRSFSELLLFDGVLDGGAPLFPDGASSATLWIEGPGETWAVDIDLSPDESWLAE